MAERPEILLVTPNWRWDQHPMPVDTLLVNAAPPLEFGYLAGSLGQDADVRVIDAYARSLSEQQFADEVSRTAPLAVVVTTTPSLLYWRCPPLSVDAARLAVRAIRQESDAPVTVIGPHGTATPEWTLAQTGADWCFRGAFERGLARLLISGDYEWSPYVVGDTAKNSAVAVLRADELPLANFDWVDQESPYPPHMWCVTDEERGIAASVTRGAILEASRGCPWSCAYCAKEPVRGKFGRRPVELVEKELGMVKARGFDYVYFIDETFNLGGPELIELLGVIARSGLSFGFQGRPDIINEDMAAQLRAAGCLYAELGIDTVSNGLSSQIGRRQRLDSAQRGIDACARHVPIVRFNRINLRTRDYVRLLGDYREDWDYPADPAFPYPGAPLGDLLMRDYGKASFDWDFARRYSWWLRIEVYLQRNLEALPGEVIESLQRAFMNLREDEASRLASALGQLVETPSDFLAANKIVMQRGPGVRARDTSS